MRPRLSIIIPIYNASNTLSIALDSLVNQKLSHDELEVILVDDKSEENYDEILNKYSHRLNLKYYYNNSIYKGPGPARQIGIDNSNGEWIGFLDADDIFCDNMLHLILAECDKIEDKNLTVTWIIEQINDIQNINKLNWCWLHGKFFYREFLDKYNIHFKNTLMTHEDVYFVHWAYAALQKDELCFTELECISGIHFYNEDSLCGRKYYNKDGEIIDFNTYNLKDCLSGTIDVMEDFFEEFKDISDKNKEECIKAALQGYISSFLVLEYNYFLFNKNIYIDVDMVKYKYKLLKMLNCDILEYLKNNPQVYRDAQTDTYQHFEPFIEHQTFEQFYTNLEKDL